ncbi:MAG TPA: urate hydroxylase PuuD [Acidobacteriota bacterium]|nr:urate hydroxylase PuuD [Acidobacteriota bacterium]
MGVAAGFEAVFRWIHVLMGVLWIGHLYFFNFVNGPFSGKIDGPTKKAVVPELMPRALFWFRWGAAWTWITGLLLLGMVYYQNRLAVDTGQEFSAGTFVMLAVTLLAFLLYDVLFKSPLAKNVKLVSTVAFVLLAVIVFLFVQLGNFSYRGTLIHTGALFGTIMAFNVWFRIWPAQQKIIRAVKEGTAPDQDLVKLAGSRSRHNTYLSVPLLWAMIGQHTTYFAGGNLGISGNYYWALWLLIILIGWHIVFQLYKKAGKVPGF